uniref:Uncharacterized protein n=1 Tax=viral metagenome TaxID=1070528 RepID=A0A6C0JDZ1_9ZZZZ
MSNQPKKSNNYIKLNINEEGDDRFDAELNDNKPYYYNLKNNEIWRRNLFGWGPQSVNI